MTGLDYSVSIAAADVAVLEQAIKAKQCPNIPMLVREIVGNWCADQRRAERLGMPAEHYTQRPQDDYSDCE